ncbi:family 2 encapsulin nanocompartment cargo protein polyprenyl transferase [Amycolatopsis sp. H20-H5]|uniref:family 2 encapsulin nanocompartment cargo protein polyprenyl transferase n=1 Tax=Amycolatopsis sp. H20-H5 TaxID=3046309 RepID=UPI002DBF6F6D|nr:family 2 encapsulin nanocompartment cargo protein polyprenyl transferase [Amycolatopsis sp. H20-H5]MEC3981329.1 family 2 encapsulin nanocompartment cargo protein polyprenyl transferase [Amycolatopsis sp. H20-H5]
MTTMDTRTGARTAADVLGWSRDAVEPALREAVDRLPGSMRLISGYHFGWWDERGDESGADGGKALRPALVLLAAEAVGADPVVAVPAAAAVELVHNFSLLHDDVMDGDVTRRHRPTAWSVFGTGAAILAGDAMVTLAYDVLAAGAHPEARLGARTLSAAVLGLIVGQSEDMEFESRADVVPAECVRMAEGKTGALLGASCTLGALAGGGDATRVERLGEFGRALGLAFQHVDDLLGIWGDPARTGKPVYSDLQNRKKSLPVVAALNSDTDAGRELAVLYTQENQLTPAQLVRAAELVDRSGGRGWSQAQADGLLSHALHQLAVMNPAPRPGAELAELARFATRRTH